MMLIFFPNILHVKMIYWVVNGDGVLIIVKCKAKFVYSLKVYNFLCCILKCILSLIDTIVSTVYTIQPIKCLYNMLLASALIF